MSEVRSFHSLAQFNCNAASANAYIYFQTFHCTTLARSFKAAEGALAVAGWLARKHSAAFGARAPEFFPLQRGNLLTESAIAEKAISERLAAGSAPP